MLLGGNRIRQIARVNLIGMGLKTNKQQTNKQTNKQQQKQNNNTK